MRENVPASELAERGRIVFYRVDWTEDGAGSFYRVYQVGDFNTLWRVVKHMNIERQIAGRPVMRRIMIKALKEYEGEFLGITEKFDENMAIDANRSRV